MNRIEAGALGFALLGTYFAVGAVEGLVGHPLSALLAPGRDYPSLFALWGAVPALVTIALGVLLVALRWKLARWLLAGPGGETDREVPVEPARVALTVLGAYFVVSGLAAAASYAVSGDLHRLRLVGGDPFAVQALFRALLGVLLIAGIKPLVALFRMSRGMRTGD